MKFAPTLALVCIAGACLVGAAGWPAASHAAAKGISIVQNEETGYFSSSEYGKDISRGAVPVYIAGSTFNQDAKAFVNKVVADMRGADWSPHAHFTGTPGPNTARIYSYAMAFGDPSVTGANLCKAKDRGTRASSSAKSSASSGGVILVAALCRYDKSTAAVTVRGASGPSDPKFRDMIRGAVLELTRTNQMDIEHRSNNGGGFGGNNH
jgi:hypothetical protein